jgi:F420H(2)-dependent quinone reductase
LNPFTALHVFIYKVSGGRIGGKFRGAPVLLLTTIGRKSGKSRTTPVLFLADGKGWVVVASNAGRPRDPSWWSNLKMTPGCEAQIRGEKRRVQARKASAEEKTRLWPMLTKMYPPYNDYQRKTKREIPVVILEQSSS